MVVMKMKFLIVLILMFTVNFGTAFADEPLKMQLTKIETEVWGFSYDNESELERIERVEKQIFGTTNPKITPDKRVEKITKALGLETYQEANSSLSDLYVAEEAKEGVEYPQIDKLESALLGITHKSDSIYVRLERLEKKAFGAKQEGDLGQRSENLQRHYSSILTENTGGAPQQNSYYDSLSQQNYNYEGNSPDIKLQISALENMIFATDFSQDPVPLRLNRLENRIFQRDFSDDDNASRIARIQAASTAKKTAKYYDNNKFQKFAATGMQAASFILMILAFIL